MLPENAIVVDESISSGRRLNWQTASALPHVGSAFAAVPLAQAFLWPLVRIACPERKIIGLQADGSAMYTVQAYGLWREKVSIHDNNLRQSGLPDPAG